MIFEINLNLSFNIAQNIFVFYFVIFDSSLTAFNLKSSNDYLTKNYRGSVGEVIGIICHWSIVVHYYLITNPFKIEFLTKIHIVTDNDEDPGSVDTCHCLIFAIPSMCSSRCSLQEALWCCRDRHYFSQRGTFLKSTN